MANILKLEKIHLKSNTEISETLIRDYIYDNTEVLGLGDLTPLIKEKIQPSGGRLDLLMAGDSGRTRYEIEIQLGATDPSHIIRTIEYWDIERKRYPQYDHCAVIIAEEITGRFMNVISLFNGNIPLIAMQIEAYRQGDNDVALVFTKVLDRITLGTEDEDAEFEPTDRKYWEKKSTPQMLSLVDNLFSDILAGSSEFALKYNKFYIGLTKDGIAKNFVSFEPKKNSTWLYIKCSFDEQDKAKLEATGLEINYDNRWKKYALRINSIEDYTANKETIDGVVKTSKSNFNI